jgi:DHA2 family methylenomycin A resistance protein-like MFS transporter
MLTAAIVSFLTAALLVAVLAPAEARSAKEAKHEA